MTIERQFADHAELQKAFGRILKNQAVSCINCLHFKRQAELCGLNNLRPPAAVIAFGCERFDYDDIPF